MHTYFKKKSFKYFEKSFQIPKAVAGTVWERVPEELRGLRLGLRVNAIRSSSRGHKTKTKTKTKTFFFY